MTAIYCRWECETCPHAGLLREEKTYKHGIQRDRSACRLCELCGGSLTLPLTPMNSIYTNQCVYKPVCILTETPSLAALK